MRITKFNSVFSMLILIAQLSGCCSEQEVPGLIAKLNSPVTHDRNQAALDLARCGGKAAPAVPRLAELLYDESRGVQSSAAYALREIDTPQARDAIKHIQDVRRP